MGAYCAEADRPPLPTLRERREAKVPESKRPSSSSRIARASSNTWSSFSRLIPREALLEVGLAAVEEVGFWRTWCLAALTCNSSRESWPGEETVLSDLAFMVVLFVSTRRVNELWRGDRLVFCECRFWGGADECRWRKLQTSRSNQEEHWNRTNVLFRAQMRTSNDALYGKWRL